MANFVFTEALEEFAKGTVDHVANVIEAILVMTNTSAATEGATGVDAEFLSNFSPPDEYDGAAYVRKVLASKAVTKDSANNKGVFDADDVTWTALGVGTRNAQASILYKKVTADTDSPPLYYQDTGGFPFAGNGSDVTIQYASTGIALFQNA